MAKVTKKEEITEVELPVGTVSTTPLAELDAFGYVFMRNPVTGVYSTVKVKFDHTLTRAEFSEVESAGTEKVLAIERLKVILATRVF